MLLPVDIQKHSVLRDDYGPDESNDFFTEYFEQKKKTLETPFSTQDAKR